MDGTKGQAGKGDGVTPGTVTFSLSGTGSVPVYRQIITQVEHGVLSGRLKARDQLPTIRALAVELKINPNTIAKAYGELEIRGLVVTRVGSGTFISDKKPDDADEAREAKIRVIVSRFLREMEELGVERNEIVDLIRCSDGCFDKGERCPNRKQCPSNRESGSARTSGFEERQEEHAI